MPLNEHTFDELDVHDEHNCDLSVDRSCSVSSECRCGYCCERLILESSLRDAEREPRIAAECAKITHFQDGLTGYLLNDPRNGGACHFFDREHRLCTIYETRPQICRVFNCDAERRSGEFVELLSDQTDVLDSQAVDLPDCRS